MDSRHVYTALEEICESRPELEPFRDTGLERVAALNTDIEGMAVGSIPAGSDPIPVPDVGEPGSTYAAFLREMADGEGELAPQFICHYYNFYFAHSAGGRMIGRKMSEMLLAGHELEFYKVRSMMPVVTRHHSLTLGRSSASASVGSAAATTRIVLMTAPPDCFSGRTT